MKFLLIAGFANSLINFRKPLIVALLNKGLSVHVAAPELTINAEVMSELNKLGVIAHDISIQRAGMNPLADLRGVVTLWQLMRRIKPDYVLGYTIKPVIYGTMAAWLARVPQRFALITGLGFAFMGMDEKNNEHSRVQAVVRTLYRTALRHCQTVFFQNPDDELLFRQLKMFPAHVSSRVVNGSGVDVAQFEVTPIVEHAAPRFLLIARLLGDKGIREYVQAAEQVKQRYPKAQFDLVGWIDENPNTITQAELDKWIAAGTITFLGRLSDVRPAIKRCSVYVLPSYREGTPRTVLEAMAMGRAVITTNAPGCRETVVEGDNGFLVPIKDTNALAEAMLRFIEKPDLITIMGQRSRAIAEEKYDVHKVNAQMLEGMRLI